MRLAELDPHVFRVCAGTVGLGFGLVATKLADALPRRYGIAHRVTRKRRAYRNVALVGLAALCAFGIAHVLTGAGDLSLHNAIFLFSTHAALATCALTGAAIDFEHMILPNELTLAPAALCLVTSPFRSVGVVGSVTGAIVGLAIAYLPLLAYSRVRGRSGMGLGDAKLSLMAGAWHGASGAVFVVFFAAVQATVAAVGMRALGIAYETPESVEAELETLRERAAAGDEDAKSELAADPMASAPVDGTLGMRLPLGPFLALGCIEVLFLRRWLVEHVLTWLGAR